MEAGKAKKSGASRNAPKIASPRKDKPFSKVKSMDDKAIKKSPQWPMKSKRLSK